MHLPSVIAMLAATVALATPFTGFTNLEKRCQGRDGDYCDSAAIRCCAGLYCCRTGSHSYACKNSPDGNPDPVFCV